MDNISYSTKPLLDKEMKSLSASTSTSSSILSSNINNKYDSIDKNQPYYYEQQQQQQQQSYRNINPIKPNNVASNGCRDPIFAILFIINIIIILYFAIIYGIPALQQNTTTQQYVSSNEIIFMFILSIVAGFMAILFVLYMINNAEKMIRIGLYFQLFWIIIMGCFYTLNGFPIFGTIFFFISCIYLIYLLYLIIIFYFIIIYFLF